MGTEHGGRRNGGRNGGRKKKKKKKKVGKPIGDPVGTGCPKKSATPMGIPSEDGMPQLYNYQPSEKTQVHISLSHW